MPDSLGITGETLKKGELVCYQQEGKKELLIPLHKDVDNIRSVQELRNLVFVPLYGEFSNRTVGIMQLVNKKSKSGVSKHDLSLMKPISKFLGACAENISLSNAAVRIAVDIRNSIELMTVIVKQQVQD